MPGLPVRMLDVAALARRLVIAEREAAQAIADLQAVRREVERRAALTESGLDEIGAAKRALALAEIAVKRSRGVG